MQGEVNLPVCPNGNLRIKLVHATLGEICLCRFARSERLHRGFVVHLFPGLCTHNLVEFGLVRIGNGYVLIHLFSAFCHAGRDSSESPG